MNMDRVNYLLTKLAAGRITPGEETELSILTNGSMQPVEEVGVPTIEQLVNAQDPNLNLKKFHGLKVYIENPKGSIRSGKDKTGNQWFTEMANHYGYIPGPDGPENSLIKVFLGPKQQSKRVFLIDHLDPVTSRFDEVKAMLGFNKAKEARDCHLMHYGGPKKGKVFFGGISELPLDQFRRDLERGKYLKIIGT